MKKKSLIVPILSVFMLFCAMGCKTGKGCDCPTFGKNEPQKEKRF